MFFKFFSLLLIIISTTINAKQCNVNFNHGVILTEQHIRIVENGITLVQITRPDQVFVGGIEIPLNAEQSELIVQYEHAIRMQVPAIVNVAIESVNAGLKAINKVISGLASDSATSKQKLQSKFDELELRLRQRFNHSDNSYYIAPQDFIDFDQIFAGEFEQEIQIIVSDSIGTILTAVNDAIIKDIELNSEDANKEMRVNTMNTTSKIDSLGKELRQEITPKNNALMLKAKEFCQALHNLNQLEKTINTQIPKLVDLNLLTTR
ncbi:DUF2884 family protein [Thalassotalea ganghwensis]